jgi:hypothetical protein
MKKMNFLSIKVILMLLCIVPFLPKKVMSQIKTQDGASINFYLEKSKKAITLSELKEGIHCADVCTLEKIIISPSKKGAYYTSEGGLVIKIYDTNNNNELVFLVKIQSLFSNYSIPLSGVFQIGNTYSIEVKENNKVILETTYDSSYNDSN